MGAALIALGAAALFVVCACVTGLPWTIALFVTGPLIAACAYTTCHLNEHKDSQYLTKNSDQR